MSGYPFVTWRLLRSVPAGGAINMALDEAILRAVAAGRVLPTLRLYAWEPACLSLGRAQSIADVDADALRAAGLGLVRRSTGGKAILHADELTYSVVAPEAEPRVAGSIVESYRRLSAGLVRGLEQLGAAGVAADQRWGGRRLEGPVCFETPSDYEVTFDGRKLVGSAQMRSLGVVLQHGALPLCGDVARICRFLIPRADPARVRARAITIEQVLGRQAAWSEAAAAFATGFAESLNLHLKPGALTKDEVAWAEELRVKKYATHEWTYKV